VLALVAVLLATLIALSQLRRSATLPPAPPPEVVADTPPVSTPRRAPRLAPVPGILDQPAVGTPSIDLLARLAVRRRIQREGVRVYLDSLLARTDSVLVRWPDRNGAPLRVHLIADTTLEGWRPGALDPIRDGMQAWNGNAAGVAFVEVDSADGADIVVSLMANVSEGGELGVTNLDWDTSGAAHHARIQVALRGGTPLAPLPAEVMRRVAAHEFGHAIGLPHSDRRDDLMYPSTPVAGPSRRDFATLQLLYAVPPGNLKD